MTSIDYLGSSTIFRHRNEVDKTFHRLLIAHKTRAAITYNNFLAVT